jgi:hypothetical protein
MICSVCVKLATRFVQSLESLLRHHLDQPRLVTVISLCYAITTNHSSSIKRRRLIAYFSDLVFLKRAYQHVETSHADAQAAGLTSARRRERKEKTVSRVKIAFNLDTSVGFENKAKCRQVLRGCFYMICAHRLFVPQAEGSKYLADLAKHRVYVMARYEKRWDAARSIEVLIHAHSIRERAERRCHRLQLSREASVHQRTVPVGGTCLAKATR